MAINFKKGDKVKVVNLDGGYSTGMFSKYLGKIGVVERVLPPDEAQPRIVLDVKFGESDWGGDDIEQFFPEELQNMKPKFIRWL